MTVLCIGGTGNVGRNLVPILHDRGERVRIVTRDKERINAFPEGVEAFVGDLDNPGIIADALEGVSTVYMAVAMGPTEAYQGLTCVNVLTYYKPDHLVYLSSDISVHAPFMPAAGTKVSVETAIRASGIPYTILRPTFFHQTDYLIKDAILGGAYIFPLGPNPVARIDVRDIAEVAAAALLDGKGVNQTVLMSSLDSTTGDQAAAVWTEALGRPVATPSQSEDLWNSMLTMLPPSLKFDLEAISRHFEDHGHPLNEADLELQNEILQHPPRGYREFVQETAKIWLAESS